jgi:catechol 2,3-dioxygenase-like lactoylglutathione lyase family enzyme
MVEIPQSVDMKEIAHVLEQNRFIRMSDEANRIPLNMGYTENGFAGQRTYYVADPDGYLIEIGSFTR